MDIARRIEQSELLTSIYGGWPTFHDAEVRQLRLLTEQTFDSDEPVLEVVMHAHRMTSELDARGYYVLKDPTQVTLRFLGVRQLQLADFESQNMLFELRIDDVSDRQLERVNFEVAFASGSGLDAKFSCNRIRVEAVLPLVSDRERRP